MVDSVLENRKIAIIKYIECFKDVLKHYDNSHQLILSLNSYRPLGNVFSVKPKILSALMTFGVVQNKNLIAVEDILDDIFNKVIPFSRKYAPDYDLTELFTIINELYRYRNNLINACTQQHELIKFSYEKITDFEIKQNFLQMAKLIKNYQEVQFKMMAIHVDYKDFFQYKQKSISEKFMDDKIKLSYELAFSICSFCQYIPTGIYLSSIDFFVEDDISYKEFHSSHSNEVIIPKK